MERTNRKVATGCSTAVRCRRTAIVLVLMAVAAYNVDAVGQTAAATQTAPEKKVDTGVGGVSDNSFKFGEYNGLQNQGPLGIGRFDLRGGAAYDSASTWRWRFTGTNLGLENRNLTAEAGKQGKKAA